MNRSRNYVASVPALAFLAMSTSLGLASAGAQAPPQLRASTHDWLDPAAGPEPTNDTWVDVKAPGDGLVYSVGTTQVLDFAPGATTFSGVPAGAAMGGFSHPVLAGPRQVVVVQATDDAQGIVWQQFFYGFPLAEPRPTNPRAISVWAAEDPADTRVAICGETFCPALPLSQDPGGAAVPLTSGFIAVYDGLGALLWSHHFFEEPMKGAGPGICAITDVSVRTVAGEEGLEDIVTYCGMSTYGDYAGVQGWLDPVAPFAAPGACATAAAGDVDNGVGQWDGIVGRLRNSHDAPVVAGVSVAVTDFHSIVGGGFQDALFGLTEINADLFAVCGVSGNDNSAGGPVTFPFTGACPAPMFDSSLGVIAVFNTDDLAGAGLVLVQAVPVGIDPAAEDGRHTMFRDIIAQELEDELIVLTTVGSTDDPNAPVGGMFGQVAIGGGVDGLVIGSLFAGTDPANSILLPFRGTYRGGEADEVLTGVQSWNEYQDLYSFVGYAMDAGTGNNIEVETHLTDNMGAGPTEVRTLFATAYGGTGDDRPAVVGAWNVQVGAGIDAFPTWGLGDITGGGIAVDPRNRTHVVGATDSPNYPLAGPAPRAKVGAGFDGVRAALDLVPVGVGRTQGTGDPGQPAAMPYPPAAPLTGGTSPECSTLMFGQRVGEPMPVLRRMHIEYEGDAPAVMAGGPTGPTLIVQRPPLDTTLFMVAYAPDFPGDANFAPMVLPEGLIVWPINNSVTQFFDPGPHPWNPGETFRFDLSPLPAGGLTMSVQLFVNVATAIPGGMPPACGNTSTYAASPAIWISY